MSKTQPVTVFLPDTRGVEISRFGMGNFKLGLGVYTYSRLAGNASFGGNGTCPGATDGCEAFCFAKRIGGAVRQVYYQNLGDDVPPIPAQCRLLRLHVSGDFNTEAYIENWIARLTERADVAANSCTFGRARSSSHRLAPRVAAGRGRIAAQGVPAEPTGRRQSQGR